MQRDRALRTRPAHRAHRPMRPTNVLTVAFASVALLALPVLPAAATPAGGPIGTDGPTTGGYPWPGIDALGLGEPAQEQLVSSVTEYVVGSVTRYVVEGSVESVDDTAQESGETVVTLSSDILFDTNDATLPKSATAKIATLVADVPKGAAVKVYGHTDSVDTDAFNQDLSERRAEAVAAAVRAARADLKLDVQGFGETQLRKPETGSEDAVARARAENRRVELRYGS